MPRRSRRTNVSHSDSRIDWVSWFKSFGVFLIGFAGLLITFYFTTTNTLKQHDEKFVQIGEQFKEFNNTLKKNYDDWAKATHAEQEKADRIREQFMNTFSQFGASSAAMKVQVDTVSKQLESVTNKLDMIQSTQRDQVRAARPPQ